MTLAKIRATMKVKKISHGALAKAVKWPYWKVTSRLNEFSNFKPGEQEALAAAVLELSK